MEKPKPSKLTKANLQQLKMQMHDSLASVGPRFGSDALNFQELVCGFKDRIHAQAEDNAWKKVLHQREEIRSAKKIERKNRSESSRSTRSTALNTTLKSKKSSKASIKLKKKRSKSKKGNSTSRSKSRQSLAHSNKKITPVRRSPAKLKKKLKTKSKTPVK